MAPVMHLVSRTNNDIYKDIVMRRRSTCDTIKNKYNTFIIHKILSFNTKNMLIHIHVFYV